MSRELALRLLARMSNRDAAETVAAALATFAENPSHEAILDKLTQMVGDLREAERQRIRETS